MQPEILSELQLQQLIKTFSPIRFDRLHCGINEYHFLNVGVHLYPNLSVHLYRLQKATDTFTAVV